MGWCTRGGGGGFDVGGCICLGEGRRVEMAGVVYLFVFSWLQVLYFPLSSSSLSFPFSFSFFFFLFSSVVGGSVSIVYHSLDNLGNGI